MTNCPLTRVLTVGLAVFLTTTTAAHAGTIVWGTPTNISGDSDVSTVGTLVDAFNLGETGIPSTTVNGVLFQAFGREQFGTSTMGNFTITTPSGLGRQDSDRSASAPFVNLSSAYQTLLQSWIGAGGPSWTLTMVGLQDQAEYAIQVWSNSSHDVTDSGVIVSAGNAVTLDANSTGSDGGVGQFVLGTFTATGTSQVIDFDGIGQGPVNGFQLRLLSTAVPEPGSAVLAGAGAFVMGLFYALRRRRSV